MATHTRKKCPHCGKTYETYSTYTKHLQNHSGIPFITCSNCGGHFVDTDIKEPALESEAAKQITITNCFFAMFIPFGALGILLTIAACNTNPPSIGLWIVAAILDLIYLSSVIYFLVKRDDLNVAAAIEYEQSYKRLQNPEYARALKNAGFDVPFWFLDD